MQAMLKYLASFLKKDWELTDYPIQVREFDTTPLPIDFSKSHPMQPVRWMVRIPNWLRMTGSGQTKEETWANLQSKFEEYKGEGLQLPRPGTKVPLQIAPYEKVERMGATAEAFFRQVLNMDYSNIMITDSSSLWHFPMEDEELVLAKIRDIFGIEISVSDDGNLAQIFEAIESKQAEGRS